MVSGRTVLGLQSQWNTKESRSTLRTRINAVLVAAAGALPALAQDHRYNVTVIDPFPGHYRVSTNAINNRGEVVGVSYGSPINNQAPYVYRPGSGVESLPFPPGHSFSVPTDINDSGVIVGYAQPVWSAEQSMVAWKYENGAFTIYPGIAFGNNINNAGTVVGRSCLSGNYFTCYFQAAPGGAMESVGPANFYTSTQWRLVDINDGGQILYTQPDALGAAVFRQPDGALTQLTAPTVPYRRTHTWAINNAGRCLARWEYNIGSQYFSKAFIWSAPEGAIEVGIPNVYVTGKGLNNRGHVVGRSGGNENNHLDMWLWTPERGNEDLDPLVDPAFQLILTDTAGINDRGQILAEGISLLPPNLTLQVIFTPRCPADYNLDTFVDGIDYDQFNNDFEAGNMAADYNGDGFVDGIDSDQFNNDFEAGC